MAVLLLPVAGPWLKSLEVLEFAEAVGATRGFAIHDGIVNDIGLRLVDTILAATSKRTGADYRRLDTGEHTEL